MARLRIGCSGWAYRDWTGPFYPQGTKGAERLAYYARRFDTCEINASFYRLPPESVVAGWRAGVPDGFLFAWKASRFISHNKKLNDCRESVELVFGRMRGLCERAGPALVQLPPQLRADPQRLAAFAKWLPKDVRCAFEFRHPSWYEAAPLKVLADNNLALAISDHHHAPAPWLLTADWAYVRGHGPGGRYAGRYPAAQLADWSRRIGDWRAGGRDVFCYFDNDVKAAAPADAAALNALCA